MTSGGISFSRCFYLLEETTWQLNSKCGRIKPEESGMMIPQVLSRNVLRIENLIQRAKSMQALYLRLVSINTPSDIIIFCKIPMQEEIMFVLKQYFFSKMHQLKLSPDQLYCVFVCQLSHHMQIRVELCSAYFFTDDFWKFSVIRK